MSPALIILMLVCAWLAVALAMLWGMLRLARQSSTALNEYPRRHPAMAARAVRLQKRELRTERKTAPRWGLFSQLAKRG